MSQSRPLSYSSRKRRAAVSAAILLLCAALSLLGGRGPAIAAAPQQAESSSCASTAAIPDPEPAGLVADCETLLGLKDELAGNVTLNWSASLPISDWEGVTVENDRVTVLDLSGKRLSGSIPSQLGQLTNLKRLGLSVNHLTGSIPSQLGQLTNLEQLYLAGNSLTGNIPSQLGQLTNLKRLAFWGNSLTGNIPSQLGQLTNLTWLNLSENQLTGSIPSQLGNLTNLTLLSLYYNQLTGTIPTELDNLVPPTGKLYSVRIATGNPGLCGPIPPALHAFSPTLPDAVNDLGSDTYPTGNLRSCSSAPLAAPDLTVQASAGAVELNWEAVQDAARYELLNWWDAETGWQPLGGDNLTGTSYTQTTVIPGTKYYYSIRTVNAAGQTSDWLKPYPAATVPAAETPGSGPPPTGPPPTAPELTANAAVGAVELSWEAVQDAARYELLNWWDAEIGWQPLGGDNLTGTSFTHTTVTPGTKYYYSIRTVNAAGQASDWLKPYPAATVPAAGTPGSGTPPTALELTAQGSQRARSS